MKATTFLTGTVVLSSMFLGTVATAEAATITNSYFANPALNHDGSHNHMMWLNSIAGHYGLPGQRDYIADGDVIFNMYDDGTANFFGTLQNEDHAAHKFDIDVWFDFRGIGVDGQGSNGPKKELSGSSYSYNGGPIDTNSWSYFDIITTGDKTSTITYKGPARDESVTINIKDVTNGGYPMQLGFGANGKNHNLGFSTWFDHAGKQRDHSDFNVDLVARPLPPSEAVPEPTMGLVLAGLAGARVLRRKKKSASK